MADFEWPKPMLATAADTPPNGDGWAHEFKWDGIRALLLTKSDSIEIRSRSSADITVGYPELLPLSESLPPGLLLDGEIVALDDSGRPSFELLQQRMHVASVAKAEKLAASVPAQLFVFDLLRIEGHRLFDVTWADRRAALESLELDLPFATVTPSFRGDGEGVLAASVANSLEGVVSKRVNSTYETGRRSKNWLKIKNIRTQEVIIGGFRPGTGRRGETIGSLLVGVPSESGLDYAGHVGTGFSDAMLKDLSQRLPQLRRTTSPFASELPRDHRIDAQWLEPRLVGEVAFTEWTSEGRLRHPAWRGLRDDKTPDEVRRES